MSIGEIIKIFNQTKHKTKAIEIFAKDSLQIINTILVSILSIESNFIKQMSISHNLNL